MPLEFKLSLGDYLALAGFIGLSVGGNWAISEARLSAVKAEIIGQIAVFEERASADRSTLREDFARSHDDIAAIVSSGLETRTNEVALAISRMAPSSKGFVVSVANMPVGGKIYENFERVAAATGYNATIAAVSDVAVGALYVSDIRDDKARMIGALLSEVSADELSEIDVRIDFDSSEMLRSAMSEALIKEEIIRLEEALNTLKQ